MARPTTTKAYLNSAQKLKGLVPSLAKYRRRKTLTRWEKSAITRAVNKVKTAGPATLHPLTKAQVKSLNDKSLVVGNGIRAVQLTGISSTAKVRIVDGEIVAKSGDREWQFVRTNPDQEIVIAEADKQLRRGAERVAIWLAQGLLERTASTTALFEGIVTAFFAQYAEDEDFENWFMGIAYS